MRRACSRADVDVSAPDRLPELGVASTPERAAADEAVAAGLEQEIEPRLRHEWADHAGPIDDPARRLRELREVRCGVLDRDDVVDLHEPVGEVGTDVDAAAVRPVVDHHRRVHRVGEVAEVRHGLVGVGLRVRRRCRPDPVGPRTDCVTPQLARLARGVRRAADHHGHPAGDGVDRVLGDEPPLIGRLRKPLARRAVDEHAVHPLADVPLEQRSVRLGVVAPVGGERRGQAGQYPRQLTSSLLMLSSSRYRRSWIVLRPAGVRSTA